MVIEDAYRSPAMQRGLARSPRVLDPVARPARLRSPAGIRAHARAAPCGVSPRSSQRPRTATHMSASALDISVVEEATGEELDRGGPYLTLSALTPMHSPLVGPQARANRALITEIMERNGFVAYPYEFWHYSSGDTFSRYLAHAGTPARFGPVLLDPTTGATSPLADLEGELNPLDEVRELAAEALRRAVEDTPPTAEPDETRPAGARLRRGASAAGCASRSRRRSSGPAGATAAAAAGARAGRRRPRRGSHPGRYGSCRAPGWLRHAVPPRGSPRSSARGAGRSSGAATPTMSGF